jgi:AcrR family transcriptional regulator
MLMTLTSASIGHNVKVINMSPERKKSTPPARVPRDTYHHGNLKTALTDAALALVAEKGPRGFTLSEAARRAGVSLAAPYRHFTDKAHLLAAVAEQGFLQLRAAMIAAGDDASDPTTRLIEIGRAYLHWAVAHSDYYHVMFGGDTVKAEHPDLLAAGAAAFDVLLDAIVRCQAAGVLRSEDPRGVAGPLWSLVHGAASLAIGGDFRQVHIDEDPADLVTRAVTASLHIDDRRNRDPGPAGPRNQGS